MSDQLKEGAIRVQTGLLFPGYRDPVYSEVTQDGRDFTLKARLPEGISMAYLELMKDGLLSVSFAMNVSNPAIIHFKKDAEGKTSINLEKAAAISAEIESLLSTQKNLKNAFYHRELDGGPKAAMTHPLYIQCQIRIDELQDELTILI